LAATRPQLHDIQNFGGLPLTTPLLMLAPYWHRVRSIENKRGMKSMTTKITIDGKSIVVSGNNIRIAGRNIYSDGELIEVGEALQVTVTGNVSHLECEDGDITVNGKVETINTKNGNVTAGDVSGDVTTKNGNIHCSYVTGEVSTKNGNVFSMKK
jgi:hypothetical protein